MLDKLQPPAGARKKRRRVGRGTGSGQGHTAGRGHKGQKSRSGGGIRIGFEGGQMPLQRRLPKRGFHNLYRKDYAVINVKDLARFDADSIVDPAALRAAGLIKRITDLVKVLGNGEPGKALTVRAQGFSKSAKEKIAAAGGKAEEIGPIRRRVKTPQEG